MNRFRSFAAGLTACLLLSGCQTVYLHDPELKTSTSKAHDALAGAKPLEPFEVQLGNLEQFAKREDLAAADYWVGVRDKHFTAYLTYGEDDRKTFLTNYINQRLGKLLGSQDAATLRTLATYSRDVTQAAEAKQNYEAQADYFRRTYLARWIELNANERDKTRPARAAARAAERVAARKEGRPAPAEEGTKRPDLSCKALAQGAPSDTDPDLVEAMTSLRANCDAIGDEDETIKSARETLKKAGGEIGTAAREAVTVDEETKVKLSDAGQAIEAEIKAAEKFAKNSAEADLADLRRKIRERLHEAHEAQNTIEGAKLGAADELAGWDKANETIDALLRAEICDAPDGAVEKTVKEEAKCPDVEAPTTTGRSQAAWALLKALAQLQDANAEARRGANWLLAAKAIVAAERADAALRLKEAKAKSAASGQRLGALIEEAAGLIAARKWLAREGEQGRAGFGDCELDITVPGPANEHCAFASYADAWNRGRLPAEMLKYRPIQIDREFGVRRSRAVAEKQYALALAGTATLKEYGEGGITPEMVASLINLLTNGAVWLEN